VDEKEKGKNKGKKRKISASSGETSKKQASA
jgi:hypothetical protein